MHRPIIRAVHAASAGIVACDAALVDFVARRSTYRGERAASAAVRTTHRRFAMTYVDGFVAAVPTANRDAFRKHAAAAAAVFREHGALSVAECWGDDVPEGKVTSFPMAVQRKDDETVVFSWITWPSREARDAGMKKVMADPRLQPETNPMPFDGKRMIYGGFEMIVSA
jgi:uncharacterized protein YbaA (DUF1428 family)